MKKLVVPAVRGSKQPAVASAARYGGAIAAFLLAYSMPARAGEIPITNAGFDTDLSGWTVTHDYAADSSSAATYDSYPDGNMLDLNAPENDSSNGQGVILQTLGTSWAAGIYQFKMAVWEPYFGQPNNNAAGTYDGGVQVQLLDGDTQDVVGSTTWTSTDGSLHQISFDTTVLAGNGAIGDPIEIVLTHTLNGDVWIDNVDLSSPPVGAVEPGSLGLLAVGCLAIVRRRHRKLGRTAATGTRLLSHESS